MEMQETRIRSLGQEDPLKEEMATYSSTLAWRIPWTEQPGGAQSMGLQSWTWLNYWVCTHSSFMNHQYIFLHMVLFLQRGNSFLWSGEIFTADVLAMPEKAEYL